MVAEAITNVGENGNGGGLWDDEDKFFYDKLILPDEQMQSLGMTMRPGSPYTVVPVALSGRDRYIMLYAPR